MPPKKPESGTGTAAPVQTFKLKGQNHVGGGFVEF